MSSGKKFNIEESGVFSDLSDAEVIERFREQPKKTREKIVKKKRGRTINENISHEKGVQQGLPKELTRATLIVNVSDIECLRDIAYTERKRIMDVVGEAFRDYIHKKTHDKNAEIIRRKGSKSPISKNMGEAAPRIDGELQDN